MPCNTGFSITSVLSPILCSCSRSWFFFYNCRKSSSFCIWFHSTGVLIRLDSCWSWRCYCLKPLPASCFFFWALLEQFDQIDSLSDSGWSVLDCEGLVEVVSFPFFLVLLLSVGVVSALVSGIPEKLSPRDGYEGGNWLCRYHGSNQYRGNLFYFRLNNSPILTANLQIPLQTNDWDWISVFLLFATEKNP